jgi:cytochrome oxidase Cu insertion factor (SCO1/SenC/PrrC family)
MATSDLERSSFKNRVFLLSIIALFGLPLALAWLLVGYWQPDSTVNHGELLTPAQPVNQLQIQQSNGQALTTDILKGRWTLAYLTAACGEHCKKSLYNMRQVRLALGKDMERVQTLYMHTGELDADVRRWLEQQHPELVHGMADAQTLDFFQQVFPEPVTTSSLGEWIYIIDPLGNLFIRYDTGSNPKGVLEDLERLLKYSKIG